MQLRIWPASLAAAIGVALLGAGCAGGSDCIDAVWLGGVRYDNQYSVIAADRVGALAVKVADSGCSDAAVGPIDIGKDVDQSLDGAATVLPVGTEIFEVIDDPDLLATERNGQFEVYKRASG